MLHRDEQGLAAADGDADRMTIGEFARQAGVTLRALRFYQSKGLLASARDGHVRVYSRADRDRLVSSCRANASASPSAKSAKCSPLAPAAVTRPLPISRKKCVEQIKLLERERRDSELALSELRAIYTGMFKAVFPAAGDLTAAF